MHTNSLKRKALALLAVLLLSVPSAIGVQHALAPTRGPIAAWMGAAGFEAVYLSTAVLVLNSELRRYAQKIALAAVITAVVLNSVADYAARNPLGLVSAAQAWQHFDGLALALSLVESLPLAGLSYAMASLLHRLAEQEGQEAEADSQLEKTTPASSPPLRPALASTQSTNETEYASVNTQLPAGNTSNTPTAVYVCRYCGADGLTKSQQLAHGRQRVRTGQCPELEARWDANGEIGYVEARAAEGQHEI